MVVEVLPGKENMQRDSDNLFLLEKGLIEPRRRIYKWSEPTVSIGYSQIERAFPVKVVRRPTGGGALLHGWDISFSITDYRESWGKDFSKIYARVMERLQMSFEYLGIKPSISRNKSRYDSFYCFDYSSFGELTFEGKKLVACAMRVLNNAFLVHGSININVDYKAYSKIMGVDKDLLMQRVWSLEQLGIKEEQVLQALSKSL